LVITLLKLATDTKMKNNDGYLNEQITSKQSV
jgi:hypothetical protein